jgi:beta-galactosidase
MVYICRRTGASGSTTNDPGYEPLQSPQVLFPDWTPSDVSPHDETVEAFSNCEEVELILNGKSLGVKKRLADASALVWKVAFEPGTLEVVGRNNGAPVAHHRLRTAGKPARIRLVADQEQIAPDWDEVCYVSAEVVDLKGVRVPTADDLITFKLTGPGGDKSARIPAAEETSSSKYTGPGVIVAVDSADNSSPAPFQASERKAYHGICFAIVKAATGPGRITLSASSPNLEKDLITIEVTKESNKK